MAKEKQASSTNKHDVAIAQPEHGCERFLAMVDLAKVAFRCIFAGVSVWLVARTIQAMIGQDASSLRGLAAVVEAFSVDRIVLILGNIILGTACVVERRGKKRAIREKGKLQRRLEDGEPNRSTSGLTDTGDLPEGSLPSEEYG